MPNNRLLFCAAIPFASTAKQAVPTRATAIAVTSLALTVLGALVPAVSRAADVGLTVPAVSPGPLAVLRGITSTDPLLDPPAAVLDAVAVTATSNSNSENSALALRSNGSVVGWGANDFGQASPPVSLTDAVSVDLGGGFAVALRSNGSVAAWGSDAAGALDVPADLGPVTAVSAGGVASPTSACGYVLALRPDHTVARWGGARTDGTCKTYGKQFDPPADLSDVIAISAGSDAALALKSDGTVVAWGSGTSPYTTGISLARWHDIVAISTDSGKYIGLQSDHSVVTLGFVSESPMTPLPANIVAVSAGETATFLSSDGSLHERGRQERNTDPGTYAAAAGGFDYTAEVVATPVVGTTPAPSSAAPSSDPSSAAPSSAAPSSDPSSAAPSTDPSSAAPSTDPSSAAPSSDPSSTAPSTDPSSAAPSSDPSSTAPSSTAPSSDPSSVPAPSGPAVGSSTVQDRVDSNPEGMAEAFQYTATADAQVSQLHLYLDASNTAQTLIVGVYADKSGTPGRMLGSASINQTVAGAWNSAAISTIVVAGQKYWLAVVAPLGSGVIRFRDLPDGEGGPTVTSAGPGIDATDGLPTLWATSAVWANAPASVYLD